jgi:4-amino-4-deoxy-L-arabinose transferase-like glycosyltransferase
MFQLHKNGKEFIELFIIKHHFKRYTGVISGHRGPVFYYVVVLIAGMFPWIGFLLRGVRNVLGMKRDLLTFALIWFLSVLAFFSLATTKLPNYIFRVFSLSSG